MSLYIKRKKVNYDLIDHKSLFSPSSSQCSLASAPQTYPHEVKRSTEQLCEKNASDEKVELEKQLKQATQSEKSWRHKFKLMENERQEYESSVQAKYEKEQDALKLELKLLRQAYLDKVQSMSTCMLQLQKTVARLERQLDANGITEEAKDDVDDEKEDQKWLLNSSREDVEFFKTAHHQALHEYPMSASHTLWASVQRNALELRQDLLQIQAWKASMAPPTSEKQSQRRGSEDGLKLDDKTLGGGLKKAIFGKTHRSVKRKSAIFV